MPQTTKPATTKKKTKKKEIGAVFDSAGELVQPKKKGKPKEKSAYAIEKKQKGQLEKLLAPKRKSKFEKLKNNPYQVAAKERDLQRSSNAKIKDYQERVDTILKTLIENEQNLQAVINRKTKQDSKKDDYHVMLKMSDLKGLQMEIKSAANAIEKQTALCKYVLALSLPDEQRKTEMLEASIRNMTTLFEMSQKAFAFVPDPNATSNVLSNSFF